MRAHRGVTLPIRENNRQIETGWIINVESENLNAQSLPVLPYVKGRGNSAKLSPLPSADQKDYMQRKKIIKMISFPIKGQYVSLLQNLMTSLILSLLYFCIILPFLRSEFKKI